MISNADGEASQPNAEGWPVLTPKAFANFSPGLERSDKPGYANDAGPTLKGLANW